MSITLQLVEVPENEQVINRQVALPESGGTVGRAYDCTLQLPDFNRQLSRIHAEIVPSPKGGYQVTDRSTNGLFLNGKLLGKGQHQRINDGDTLKLGAYTLLISDMDALFAESDDPFADEQEVISQDPLFSSENIHVQESAWPLDDHDNGAINEAPAREFSAENVLADDQFGYDPFDDEIEMLSPGQTKRESSNNVVTVDRPAELDGSQQLNDGLRQLQSLIEQQKRLQAEPFGHDQLMDCLQRTLDRFLEELHPDHLEDTFDDYISGWGGKEKKYWRLYRKQFKRKLDRKEFHRQFSALFVEELRGKGQ